MCGALEGSLGFILSAMRGFSRISNREAIFNFLSLRLLFMPKVNSIWGWGG